MRLFDRVASSRRDLLYGEYYDERDRSSAETEADLRNPTFAYRRRRLEGVGAEMSLFEIGCGDGNFLATLARKGWRVAGLEFSSHTSDIARRRYRIDVQAGDVLDGDLPRPVETLGAYHVFEHVYEPRDWLDAVHAALEPNGVLHLQVPNYRSLGPAIAPEFSPLLVFPEHVYFYTPRTLTHLVERAGFDVLDISTYDPWHGPGVFAGTVANLARWSLAGTRPYDDYRLEGRLPSSRLTLANNVERGRARRTAHAALDRVSRVVARVEAAAGFGAVVDLLARRSR